MCFRKCRGHEILPREKLVRLFDPLAISAAPRGFSTARLRTSKRFLKPIDDIKKETLMRHRRHGCPIHVEVEDRKRRPCSYSRIRSGPISTCGMSRRSTVEKFRVVRYDQRGHGKTGGRRRLYAGAARKGRACRFRRLKIERAHFCGLSMAASPACGSALRAQNAHVSIGGQDDRDPVLWTLDGAFAANGRATCR